jgi:IPT/TIG domain
MKRSLSICLLAMSICILPNCGGGGSGSNGSGGSGTGGGTSTPTITSISPTSVASGGPAFTLTVNGKNFTNATTVQLTSNGSVESGVTTTFVSNTKLTAAVPASAIATTGTLSVALLQNGEAVSSKGVDLTVAQGNPHITSISPTTLTEGGPAFTLTVNGTGFIQNDSIVWNGDTGPFPGGIATFVSSTQLTIAVPAQAIAYPGSAEIQVVFYVVDGANITSNEVPLVVNPALGVAQSASVGVNGATPNGPSSNPEISDDGRFISFASQATNLVTPTTLFPQVYVYDDCVIACSTPTTLLVSAEPAGSPANPVEPNGQSVDPSLGAIMLGSVVDGFQGIDHFAFLSAATNLVLPSTTQQQAYLRNTCYVQGAISGCNPINYLVSATQSGAEPNGPATDVILPKGGCNVAFISSGTDLIAGVTTPNELYLSDCNSTESESPIFATSTVLSESNSGMPRTRVLQNPRSMKR